MHEAVHNVACWVHSLGEVSGHDEDILKKGLARQGVKSESLQPGTEARLGVCIFGSKTPELLGFLQIVSNGGQLRVIAVAGSGASLDEPVHWDLLQAGASDVLAGSDPDHVAREIKARFERWLSVEQLVDDPSISELVVAKSPVWRTVLRDIVDIARFSDASVLILGETGTGKEIVARLIHLLDARPRQARPRGSRLLDRRAGAVGQRVLWS